MSDASSSAAARALTPRVGWDLRLHPPALEQCVWRERVDGLAQRDLLVVLFQLLIVLGALSFSARIGLPVFVSVFGPPLLVHGSWAYLLAAAPLPAWRGWYARHRVSFATVQRCVLWPILVARAMRDLAHLPAHIGNNPSAPGLTLVMRFTATAATLQNFIDSIIQIPWLANTAALTIRAVALMCSRIVPAYVLWSNHEPYYSAATALNRAWAGAIQPPLRVAVPRHESLDGRSTDVLLGLTTTFITGLAVALYVTYINAALELRMFLRRKAAAAAAAPSGTALIGGAALSRQQLLRLLASPGAALALDGLAARGVPLPVRAAAALLHAVAVGALCVASLWASEALVYAALPRLLAGRPDTFEIYYPPRDAGLEPFARWCGPGCL